MRPLRVGVVGTGYFSQFHYDAWCRCAEVDLVGIAGLDQTETRRLAAEVGCRAYDDAAALLDAEAVDLLDIITPPKSHAALIDQAVARGVNVVCQKPFCETLQQAKSAASAAQQAGVRLIVHENFRFQPWYAAIKAILKREELGQLYQATFRLRPGDGQGADAYLDRQPYFRTMERFLVHETAVHLIDVFRYLFGEVHSVWADLTRINPAIAGEDRCLIVMEHEHGVRTLMDGNRNSDHRAENRRLTMGELLIEGENGVLSVDGDARLTFRRHGSNDLEPIEYEWNDRGFGGDCVYRFTRHVVDHFINATALANEAEAYLTNLEIEEGVYRSGRDGHRVLF